MNINVQIYSSKLALLCLLSGFVLSAAPAKASSLELKLSQSVESDRIAETNNKPIVLSQSIEQVTSVSQLSDVQPTDWAFQALQSLVERYGCIAGYPDGTYRGNRALTRYEFAAGLNACLDRVNELIATAGHQRVSK